MTRFLKKTVFSTLLTLALNFSIPLLSAQTPLTIVNGYGEAPAAIEAKELLTAAYQKLGVTITIIDRPGMRSIAEVAAGKFDAELFRNPAIEADYPRIVRVDEPIASTRLVAYTREGHRVEHQGYLFPGLKIATHHSYTKIVHNLSISNPPENLEFTYSDEHLILLLQRGRIDAIVAPEQNFDRIIRENGTSGITKQEPPVDDTCVYHYLAPHHADLADDLAEAIRNVKEKS